MKGEEPVTQFVLEIIIVILVVGAIIWIALGVQVDLTASGEDIDAIYQPDKFSACVPNKEGKCVEVVKETNVFYGCDSSEILLKDLQFVYCSKPQDYAVYQDFRFLLLLTYKNNIIKGHQAGNEIFLCEKTEEGACPMAFKCTQFSSDNPLRFSLQGLPLDDRILLHITAWKYNPRIISLVNSGTSFARLIGDSDVFPNYLASVDIPVKAVDPANCANVPTCPADQRPVVFPSGYTCVYDTSTVGTCSDCISKSGIWCSEFNDGTGNGRCVPRDPAKAVSDHCNIYADSFFANIACPAS